MKLFRAFSLGVLGAITVVQIVSAQSKPPDWRLFGFAKPDGKDVEMFYSATELRRNRDGHIEVWAKGLLMQAVNNATLDTAHIESAATKLNAGYQPPVAQHGTFTKDKLTDAIAAEEAANQGDVLPVVRMLFELDCEGRMGRTLSLYVKAKGKESHSERESEWTHTAPETNLSALMDDLCPRR